MSQQWNRSAWPKSAKNLSKLDKSRCDIFAAAFCLPISRSKRRAMNSIRASTFAGRLQAFFRKDKKMKPRANAIPFPFMSPSDPLQKEINDIRKLP
jgi:hypothetical protein